MATFTVIVEQRLTQTYRLEIEAEDENEARRKADLELENGLNDADLDFEDIDQDITDVWQDED